jgi:beta-galactosidase
VGEEVGDLQADRGGPIILVQVENEYGSFGQDPAYKDAIRRAVALAGFRCPLYTSDGPDAESLDHGGFADLLPAINFGAHPEPKGVFKALDDYRAGIPRMCGEYWTGWFDHYGESHHTTDAAAGAKGVAWMLQRGISFNLYMFHGGTTFGFLNGANWGEGYGPDTTSYDYDSMLDEAGRPTPKYFVYRDTIKAALPKGETLPELPAPLPLVAVAPFRLTESAPLAQVAGTPVQSEAPLSMEALGQNFGYVLYSHPVTKAARGVLNAGDVRDFAVVSQGSRILGTLDRRLGQRFLDVELKAGEPLEILVENTGRVNFDQAMVDERKGLLGKVTLGGRELKGWACSSLPLDSLAALRFQPGDLPAPAFHRGTFELAEPGDTFLDMRGWGKGQVFVNGRNLGRHWRLGPAGTLYCPAPFLRKGANEVVVLELEPGTHRELRGLTEPVFLDRQGE